MGRTCSICSIALEEFDPHLTCKRCRQPNASKFYCSNMECKACSAIQSYKPLEYFLKTKTENAVDADRKSAESSCGVSTPKKPVTDDKSSNFLMSMVDLPSETSIENRLYGRILSTLFTSFKNQGDKNPLESLVHHKNEDPCENIRDKDINLSDQMAAVLDGFLNGSHKLSSKCGDILAQHTLLSDPSKAESLTKHVEMVKYNDFWPANINSAFILKICSEQQVSMKFHPKARQFQTMIFGEFNPKLPKNIMGKNYCLQPPSEELTAQFLNSQQKLQILLFIYSINEILLASDFGGSCQGLSDIFISVIDHIESLIIGEANCFGLIVQSIRKFMLSGAECRLKGALDKLIYGSTHQSQFFGPFVSVLSQVIKELGTDYCIINERVPLLKLKVLPKKYITFNIKIWKKNCADFFTNNVIKDEDKLTVALYLLPKGIKSMLYNGGKRIKNKDYEYLVNILERNLCTREIILKKKMFYARVQTFDESVTSFASDLQKLLPQDLSSEAKEIMLREQFLCGIFDNLLQEKLCQQLCLTFTECVSFSEQRSQALANGLDKQSEENKSPKADKKRKRSTSSHEESRKQIKLGVQNYPASNLDDLLNYISLDNMESYDIICPWTGLKLRSLAA